MKKLSEMADANLLRVFVYGEPGTGKTVGASTFPGPIMVYDFDGKLSSAHGYWSKHNSAKLNEIEFEDCKPVDSKGTAFKRCNESLDKIAKEYKATGKLPYSTVVIDSATIMATEMLNWVVAFETGIKRNKDIKSRQMASLQDYMIFAPTFSSFIFELFALPWNVMMTGHVAIDKDELTGEISRNPLIPGQMSKKLPIYFNEVYVSLYKNDKYVVQTKPDYKYSACRSQIQGLPKEVEFTYENLIKKY